MSRVTQEPWALVALAAGIIVGAWALRKLPAVVAGTVTGDNAVTRSATNAQGQPTTAYVGAGVLGTAGAVTNAASGGTLASLGEWLGAKVYDWTHPGEPQPDAGAGQSNSATQPSGWDYSASGEGLTWEQASQPDGWWPYGVRP